MPQNLAKDLETLASARVFFGHQSVGNNIVNGLESIAQEVQGVDLSIMDIESFSESAGGCLAFTGGEERGATLEMCGFWSNYRSGAIWEGRLRHA